MREHLVKDLRLLWRVLCSDARPAAEPPKQTDELLKAVFQRTTDAASEVLGEMCSSAAGAEAGGTDAPPRVPELELIASPIVPQPEVTLGVRVRQRVRAGSVLAFYPGRIFPLTERNLPWSNMLFSNEYEGVSMDGAGWYPQRWRGSRLLADLPKTTMWHGNQLAVGNLLNHPPGGTLPNVVPMAFRWPTWQELGQATPAHWARFVPHVVVEGGQVVRTASGERSEPAAVQNRSGEEGRGASSARVWFPPWPHMGVALVSVRPVEPGEELFWNYRLHPRSDSEVTAQYPPWYTPVDDAELEAAVRAALPAA